MSAADEMEKQRLFARLSPSYVSCRAKAACSGEQDVVGALEKKGWGKELRLEIYRELNEAEEEKIDKTEAQERWQALRRRRPAYDTSEVYDFITKLQREETVEEPLGGVVRYDKHIPGIAELRLIFIELDPSKRQIGIDDSEVRYREEWYRLGTRLVQSGRVALIQKYIRRGAPASLRPALWRIIFLEPSVSASVEDNTSDIYEVNEIKDNDYYFPFEEMLTIVIKKAFCLNQASLPKYQGLIHYAAPLAFLYLNEDSVLSSFQYMFHKFWYKLHNLSTLLPLSKLFERLLTDRAPRLFLHLIELQIQPLSIALPWIQSAFVTVLDVDQILLLWDRIIGFNDLSLLPILAAAIFLFRSNRIMQLTSSVQIKALLSSDSCSLLSVVPLLQLFLFADTY